MQFNLTGTIIKILKSGSNSRGEWYLYQIKEIDRDKSWTIFTKEKLQIDAEYEICGTITESPNKNYKNEAGKVAYSATFNAGTCVPRFSRNEPPSMNDSNEEIPF
jgi:hypothetical protein